MITILADGKRVACTQPLEPRVIDRDIRGYFAHGISLAPGDTVLDVGANIGLFALRALERCDLRMYCVEPIPQLRAALAKNLGTRATIIPYAIGGNAHDDDRGGTPRTAVDLEYFPYVSGTSGVRDAIPSDESYAELLRGMAIARASVARFIPRIAFHALSRLLRANRAHVTCELRTLSQIIDEYRLERIALLKLDIEGCERAALESIDDVHWPRIDQIVAELHDRRRDLAPLTELLHRHGFTVSVTGGDIDCCNLYAKRCA